MNCLYCGHPASLRCSKCKGAYCSKECQKKDFRSHKSTCVDPLFVDSEQEQRVYNLIMDSVIGHQNTDGFVLCILQGSGRIAVDFLTFAENAPEIGKLRADKVLSDAWIAKIRANENPDLIFAIIFKEKSGGEWQCVPIEINAPRPSDQTQEGQAQDSVVVPPCDTQPAAP